MKKREKHWCDKNCRMIFRHVRESANVGTWDSSHCIKSPKYLRKCRTCHTLCISGSVSPPSKPPPRDCLRCPNFFIAFSEEQWRVGFRRASSSCLLFLSFFLFRSPLRNHRRKSSYSHWITLTFTTLSASTISSSSSSTLHGMFRFCHLFLLFFVPGWCLLYLSWSVTFASTLF